MNLTRKISHLPVHLKNGWTRRNNDRRVQALAFEVAAHAPLPGHPPVVFFNASTRLVGMSLNAGFSLLTSWALRLSGVPVVHFVCRSGLTRCVLGTDRDNPDREPPCGPCIAQSEVFFTAQDVRWFEPPMSLDDSERRLEAALQPLNLENLTSFSFDNLPLGSLALPSMRWVLRRHHLQDDEPTRFLYRHYILSAWRLAGEFSKLLDEVNPQCVVVFNGMFYPEATARWVAQQHGLRVISHEVGLQPFSAYFTKGEATAYPIDIPADFELDPAQTQRLDAYLDQRFKGNFSMAGVRFWPEMARLPEAFLQKMAAFKQVVPVFTNVIFDTSQPHSNVVFSQMFAWLDLVLDIARSHPDTLFVIRAHPDESRPGKDSRESVRQWAERNHVASLPNVHFVDSSEFFSSYELIQHSKFVMIYNSTIGLEASIMGAAVLCGGKARFTQYPTVFFPPTPDAYKRQAEDFLAADEIMVPPEFQRNARRFLYYQLFRTSLPFSDLLEEDGVWNGFVRLKDITWRDLTSQHSETLNIVVQGILNDCPFLLDD